jgi:ABC-2 type transport system permease protein
MTGFWAFARKEAAEILRTWRIWVLPGMLIFFALTGPLMARFTPEIITAVGGDQVAALAKAIPTPTYLDSYAQWAKNLTQIALFAVIIIYGGLISGERKSGTAILVLTKPVSRAAFVVAKASVHAVFVSAIVVAGTLVTWAGTALVFGKAPGGPLWSSAMAWLAFGLLFLAIMTLLSTLFGSQAGAAGIGLGLFAVISVAGILEPLAKYSPVGLAGAPMTLAMGKEAPILWPVITSAALACLLVAAAAWAFKAKEL